MNERIKELVRQADACYIPRYDMWQMDTETLEKFAELIVQECIWALWTEECRVSDLASEEYIRGSNKINNHFWG